MIVYLIGHGYYAEMLQEIEIPFNCEIRFYVPETQLYDYTWSPYYIWNDGNALPNIEDIPRFPKRYNERGEVVPLPALNIHGQGALIHDHLLYRIETTILNKDLKHVDTFLLNNDGINLIWENYFFEVYQVQNVRIPDLPPLEKEHQYAITPQHKPFGKEDENRRTAFRLSWLIRKISELCDMLEREDNFIQICWLACRDEYEVTDRENGIEHIYPEEP